MEIELKETKIELNKDSDLMLALEMKLSEIKRELSNSLNENEELQGEFLYLQEQYKKEIKRSNDIRLEKITIEENLK